MALTFSFVAPTDEAFAATWERRLGVLTPECSLEHLRMLIACEPYKEHYFVVGLDPKGEVVAVAYLAVQPVAALGLRWRVLTLGGSIGADALWIDLDRAAYAEVVRELLQFAKRKIRHSLVVLKPFDAARDSQYLKTNEEELHFINVYGSAMAEVDLSGVRTYDDYLTRLDKKKRYYLKKVDKDADLAGATVEVRTDFSDLVPTLYPLFQNVGERAKEVRDLDPLGIDYLERLNGLTSLRPQAVIVRAQDRIVGFLVLLEKGPVLSCGVCGLDHSVVKTYNTWYLLMLQAIKYGIESGKERVILGTTNFSMKRKLGARRSDLWVSLRFSSRALTSVLAPVIRMWLRRNLFLQSAEEAEAAGAEATT